MASVAESLKNRSIQLEQHEYRYDVFGSWYSIVRRKGTYFRLIYDGRNGRLILEDSKGVEVDAVDTIIPEVLAASVEKLLNHVR